MPSYRYKAIDPGGTILQGTIEAPACDQVIEQLQKTGHLPIVAERIPAGGAGRLPFSLQSLATRKISRQDVLLFTGELATLLQAGLPLDRALRTLAELNRAGVLQDLLQQIAEGVRSGLSLSETLAEHKRVFDPLYRNMIRAGEVSGTLEQTLSSLALFLERMAELRNSVINALIYPAILLIVCMTSLIFLMGFVVPRFIPLFEDAGQSLPLLTETVFALSALFSRFGWLPALLAVFAVWFFNRQLNKAGRRLAFDGWCLRLPLLRELIVEMETSRFARTLATATGNGVPLLPAMRLAREVISNRTIAALIDPVISSLEQGEGMAGPLRSSGICPDLAIRLIEVGEESSQLEAMLTRVADIYDRKIQVRIKRLLGILEPVLILGLGGLVALIILSIVVAMLNLNDLVI